MSYTQVPTYTTNQLITASHANTYWRDNINELWPFTAAGDIAYASGAADLTRLAVGADGYVLRSTGTLPAWEAYERVVHWRIVPKDVSVSVGSGQDYMFIPSYLNGYNLISAHAGVDTPSSSGAVTIRINNTTDGVDMLSTAITIDANEQTSYTAATPPVIDTSHDDVATADRISIYVDTAGTGTKGLVVILVFALP